jgi:Holliday junction DNA helicase RuvB
MMQLDRLVGQDTAKRLLKAELERVRKEGSVFPHTVLTGPAGVGKSTLAKAISIDLGYDFHPITADPSWRQAQVTDFLLRLPTTGYDVGGRRLAAGKCHTVFIDEVHRLPDWEAWYEPTTTCNVMIGQMAWLPDFSWIGATTNINRIPHAMRTRLLEIELEPYTVEEVAEIIERSRLLPADMAMEVALRSRGIARLGLKYAERVKTFGSLEWFDLVGIAGDGTTKVERRYLELLAESPRPLSLQTLSSRLGCPRAVLEEVVEPFLIGQGRVVITNSGRQLTSWDRGPKAAAAAGDSIDLFTTLAG